MDLLSEEMFTADGRSPPSAVYNESFPTGIPIPYTDVKEEIATKSEESPDIMTL